MITEIREVPNGSGHLKTAAIDPEGWEPGGRSKGLGGTDIAAILGLHPYRTPFDVFAAKVGIVDESEREETAPMHWGNVLEPVILAEYARRENVEVESWGKNMLRSLDRPWHQGTVDATAPAVRRVVEAKNVGLRQASRWGEPGTDSAPEEYVCQVAWYMPLVGYDRADIAVLVGGNDYRIYQVHRDAELEAVLLEAGERFWKDHVLADVPPAPIGRSVERFLRERFPRNVEPLRPATGEELLIAKDWRERKSKLDEIDLEVEVLANRLRLAIGEADGIDCSEFGITWKKAKDTQRVDYQTAVEQLLADTPELAGVVRKFIEANTTTRAGVRRLIETKGRK